MTALGTTAAEDGGACLGLHAREEAVGLGAVTAIGLKGTLRHDKKLLRQEIAPAQTLAIAAISEYTRWDGIFTGNRWHSSLCQPFASREDHQALRLDFGRDRSYVRAISPLE